MNLNWPLTDIQAHHLLVFIVMVAAVVVPLGIWLIASDSQSSGQPAP
jgi:hypothetical protein